MALPVTYQPGANPDIFALSLGDSKFKESLLPEPDVIRSDELNVFPADFLDQPNEIDVCSDLVTTAAAAFAAASYVDHETDSPCIGPSPCDALNGLL